MCKWCVTKLTLLKEKETNTLDKQIKYSLNTNSISLSIKLNQSILII